MQLDSLFLFPHTIPSKQSCIRVQYPGGTAHLTQLTETFTSSSAVLPNPFFFLILYFLYDWMLS
jgi:hypothetical protein